MKCNGDGTLAGTDTYSSPAPVIGLYIAGGSLVCFILILCDVCSGFRNKKLWIPCRFFSLNSLTLTIVSIATKIPVDLTTAMPSVEDQLSKLTGTAFICVTMCFIVPSIGTKGIPENVSNIAALSLSAIAMIVNVCMQMSTGLIASYLVVEHAIILFLMLVLLIAFWFAVLDIGYLKANLNRTKEVITEDFIKLEENVKNRLYISYLCSYISSPQFEMCRDPSFSTVAFVCTGCSAVLFETILRVLVFEDLEFCSGVSDYKWSVWLIVVIQILSVVLVCFAILSRGFINATTLEDFDRILERNADWNLEQFFNWLPTTNLPKSMAVCCTIIFVLALMLHILLKGVYFRVVSIFMEGVCCKCFRREYEVAEPALRALVQRYKVLSDLKPRLLLVKAVDDMARCIENNKDDSLKHLVKLLSKVPPSSSEEGFNSDTSCLSLVVLFDIARRSTPASLNMSLKNILAEVFDDIDFIDRQINITSLRSFFAKGIWKYKMVSPPTFEPHSQVEILDESGIEYYIPLCNTESAAIVRLINRGSYATRKELYDRIEQVFGDMLRFLLVRRTDAILKCISDESPQEEYEDRVRRCLKLYCKYDGTESLLLGVLHSV